MPLDVGFGGGGVCPVCGNTGMATDRLPPREAQRFVEQRYPGATVTSASATRWCDCRHGEKLKGMMLEKERPDGL